MRLSLSRETRHTGPEPDARLCPCPAQHQLRHGGRVRTRARHDVHTHGSRAGLSRFLGGDVATALGPGPSGVSGLSSARLVQLEELDDLHARAEALARWREEVGVRARGRSASATLLALGRPAAHQLSRAATLVRQRKRVHVLAQRREPRCRRCLGESMGAARRAAPLRDFRGRHRGLQQRSE